MSKPKLTPWFSGDTKPPKDRIGPYKRDYGLFGIGFCWWDGCLFGQGAETRKGAEKRYHKLGPSNHQNLPWRGVMK